MEELQDQVRILHFQVLNLEKMYALFKNVLDAAGGFDDPFFRKTIDENIVVLRQDSQSIYADEFNVEYSNSS